MSENYFHLGADDDSAPNGLDAAFYDVRDFHKVFGQPAPTIPKMIPPSDVAAVKKWIEDECQEFHIADNVTDQVDAGMDIIYFGLGILVRCGVLPSQMWNFVHGRNMDKQHTDEDGNKFVVKSSIGKVVKPIGWTGPEEDIFQEILRQIEKAPLAHADLRATVSA